MEFSKESGVYTTLKAFKTYGNGEGLYTHALQSELIPEIWGDNALNEIEWDFDLTIAESGSGCSVSDAKFLKEDEIYPDS